nr:ceramide synthase 1 isoform X2 [Equus caballus]
MAAAGTASGPEPMPSYAQLVQRGWGSALAAARGCADCGWGLARRGLAEHAHLAPPELLLLALCALGWTALRAAATARLFRPLAKWCRLQPRDAAKMPESAWKFLFYLGAWSYSAYLLFGTDYPFFHDPPSVFYGTCLSSWDHATHMATFLTEHMGISHMIGCQAWRCRGTSQPPTCCRAASMAIPSTPRCTWMPGARTQWSCLSTMWSPWSSSSPHMPSGTITWASSCFSYMTSVTCSWSSPSSMSTSSLAGAPTIGCMPWRRTWAASASASAGSGSASTGSRSRSCTPLATAACARCLTSPSTSSSTRSCCCSPP